MVRFSKYEFYNKLLGGVTLLRVTPDVIWTQSYININININIYIYIYISKILITEINLSLRQLKLKEQ